MISSTEHHIYFLISSIVYPGQSEYQRGVSAWNFDVEDLKAQASLVCHICVIVTFNIRIIKFRLLLVCFYSNLWLKKILWWWFSRDTRTRWKGYKPFLTLEIDFSLYNSFNNSNSLYFIQTMYCVQSSGCNSFPIQYGEIDFKQWTTWDWKFE